MIALLRCLSIKNLEGSESSESDVMELLPFASALIFEVYKTSQKSHYVKLVLSNSNGTFLNIEIPGTI